MNKYFFISDIHLGLGSKEKEDSKEKLLAKLFDVIKAEGTELFILGDLFDFWFEYRNVYQKGFYRTLTALRTLTESGVKVHYFIGNHDFMHRDFFAKELNILMYENPLDIVLEDKRFFLGHGDGLVENDMGYNLLKKVLRNKTIQFLYSLIHPDLGVALARYTSRSSRDYTTKKDYGKPDGLVKAAEQIIDSGFDYVLFGHLHKRNFSKHNSGCYINLGSWLDFPCYGVYSNHKFEVIDWC
ncbi:MAG: UDP-2,3-diacylglucosamine diphosphatase [Bacteroidota bacterium]|nr:UDP-2,3-diacylglucosamine diphosphatase [Bacteroidota bacterium]